MFISSPISQSYYTVELSFLWLIANVHISTFEFASAFILLHKNPSAKSHDKKEDFQNGENLGEASLLPICVSFSAKGRHSFRYDPSQCITSYWKIVGADWRRHLPEGTFDNSFCGWLHFLIVLFGEKQI